MPNQDHRFLSALAARVDKEVEEVIADGVIAGDGHRRLMDRAKLLVCAFLWRPAARSGDTALLGAARSHVAALRSLQGPSGLFIGGDNVDSPPDSAFTVNDVCDVVRIVRTASGEADAEARVLLDGIAAELDAVADAVEPALVAGGVHTPNHRWEISAALARLHRLHGSERSRARAEQWLAEGIDVDADGVYSERSANYAAHVSNPSLTVIDEVLGRDDARDAVVRNLESTLALIHPDGTVETVHSRRQDQASAFPVAAYLVPYRRFAVRLGRADLAWAAGRALDAGVEHASTVLAELLLDPSIGEVLPEAVAPALPIRTAWPGSGLVVDATERRRLVVNGGSDYARFRRIRSGLANNPTFLRLFAGAAVLDSVRLSRDFFGLGPFRADGLESADGRHVLSETVSASYYQPMAPERRDPGGAYALSDDGRFYGSMAFSEREADAVALSTSIEVVPTDAGADLVIRIDGPDVAWALELAFRDGGEFEGEGLVVQPDGSVLLASGTARYRAGSSAIAFGRGNGERADAPARYLPGEDYAFLHATDAAGGRRAYITGRSPSRLTVTLAAG